MKLWCVRVKHATPDGKQVAPLRAVALATGTLAWDTNVRLALQVISETNFTDN